VATDGGGSIRVPSAFTGVIGFKPTFGRVPTHPAAVAGVPPVVGPITRSIRDIALVLTVIAGADERDPFRLPADGRDYLRELDEPLDGLSIGASSSLGYATIDVEIGDAFERTLEALRARGATVVRCDPDSRRPRRRCACSSPHGPRPRCITSALSKGHCSIRSSRVRRTPASVCRRSTICRRNPSEWRWRRRWRRTIVDSIC